MNSLKEIRLNSKKFLTLNLNNLYIVQIVFGFVSVDLSFSFSLFTEWYFTKFYTLHSNPFSFYIQRLGCTIVPEIYIEILFGIG